MVILKVTMTLKNVSYKRNIKTEWSFVGEMTYRGFLKGDSINIFASKYLSNFT